MKKTGEESIELTAADKGHQDKGAPEQAPGYVLLPGDPNRIAVMASQWDSAEQYVLSRGQKAAHGVYRGAEIGAYSTGIGGPSTECTLTDLCGRGTHTFIRVGTTGTIQENIRIGDIIINDSHVRLDGTSQFYMRSEYPAAASCEVVLALVQACENLGFAYHVGTGCTCGSFYTGQCRTTYGGYRPSGLDDTFADLKQAGVLNFEMEGATVATLSRIFGKRAGMCATVVAHRITGEWNEDPDAEKRACLAGAEAIKILAQWDEMKASAGRKYFFPGLLKGEC
ncbi:MAG: nucleoside phosphorylase [Oscillospiraceae bacterium]|nr:nucleoside phosphorylase [Oscillospiraceae bacterium]